MACRQAMNTVNSEIFARVLFSRYIAAKFHENKILTNWRNHCRLLIWVNHALVANFNNENIYLNAIRENKILAKISKTQHPYKIPQNAAAENDIAVCSQNFLLKIELK